MSDFIVEIIDPAMTTVTVETSFLSNINNIDIERYETYDLEIVNTEKILVSDLPDNISFDKIKKHGIDGVDYYLDHYEFDCGTP